MGFWPVVRVCDVEVTQNRNNLKYINFSGEKKKSTFLVI